jgi:Vitamin K-dependent gamma-carboxylase
MSKLEQFFFAPVAFRGLYVMRAAFGAIAVFYYLRLSPHVPALFGPDGVGGHATAVRWPTFPLPVPENFDRFTWLSTVSSLSLVWLLYGLLLLSAALFTLGLRTRLAGLALVVLHVLFTARQPLLPVGWTQLYPVFVAYLTLAPSGAAWSLDSRRSASLGPVTFSAWPLRLLQVHVVAMYATAGWPRLRAEAWLKGETVLHAVSDTRFGRWDLDWWSVRGLLAALSYYALFIEPAATVLLPFRATRRWCALGLIALHLGIELVADLGMWQFTMAAAVLSFLPDRWFRFVPGLRQAPGAMG